jgi:hypothetical protein
LIIADILLFIIGTLEEDTKMYMDDNKQQKLDDLYWELGKAYYEGGFEEPLPQLLPLFDQITRLLRGGDNLFTRGESLQGESLQDNEMDYLQERIEAQANEIAQPGFCPECGHRLRPGALFCSGCGQPLG